MKKLLSIMIGLTLLLSTASPSFATQEEKKEKKKKKKEKKPNL